jgi:acetate---CoA ligase (ADP-forming)
VNSFSLFLSKKVETAFMINDKLINPRSIVVIGGSDDLSKPGGKVLKNIIDGSFAGTLSVVNPKSDLIQGIKSFRDLSLLPETDLAILAIPAAQCLFATEILAKEKNTKAFIILSAGFGEESARGKQLEREIVKIIDSCNGCLIGPNCIGLLNNNYHGIFTTPIPKLKSEGIDLISGSGATAVFIMESAIPNGLVFSSVWSVGNGAQTGVEDVLEYLDQTFIKGESPAIKLLYIESIEKPAKLLKHASSLISKGCRIAAIKAGSSEAGSRAASSHTGALATSDTPVDALLRKSGIIRCYSKAELVAVASVLMHPTLKGRKIGIITHAGGPAVMLTDALAKGGLEIPGVRGPKAEMLREKLLPGSSASNPFDFLATGTAIHLGQIINACEYDFENIDAMAVIFGSPGLLPVTDVYDLLDQKIKSCKKPIYAILPSVLNVRYEIDRFLEKGNVCFTDEVVFANALTKVVNNPGPALEDKKRISIDKNRIRSVIDNCPDGYLTPADVSAILDASGINRVPESIAGSAREAIKYSESIGYPVVMKVVGPVHKSDADGVALNVSDKKTVQKVFDRFMKMNGVSGVLIQKMLKGTELYAGVKAEGTFGHIIMTGLGGIFIEVLKDVSAELAPVSEDTAKSMIQSLRSYPIIKGVRGKPGINESGYLDIICRLSALVEVAPEIQELDLNPLIAGADFITTVDARIFIEKK